MVFISLLLCKLKSFEYLKKKKNFSIKECLIVIIFCLELDQSLAFFSFSLIISSTTSHTMYLLLLLVLPKNELPLFWTIYDVQIV